MAQAPEITIHQLEARIKRLEKCCEEEKIEDGSIQIIVRDMFGKRYSIYVKPTDPCQTIIDKYKLKLLKEHKWPVNENEYKYILKYLGNDVDVYQKIEDIGLGIESTVYIMLKENNMNELRQKIEDLEKCCKEFKKMQIGDMISFSGIMPNNLIYTNILRGSRINNVLKHIFKDKDNFQNFIEILENIDVIDDNNIYVGIEQIIETILKLFRQNSHYNTITDEQFEILVRLFIRKKWHIGSSWNNQLYFDDVDFVTKYYTMFPKREREIEYEKKFEEIIKRSKIIKPTGEESKEDDRKGESKEDGKKLKKFHKKSYRKSKKFMSKSKLKSKSKRNKSRRKSIRKNRNSIRCI